MHSINAYFGSARITPQAFANHIIKYDTYLNTRFNITTSCATFDLMNSDQSNLVTHILKQYGIHCRYYALNTIYKKKIDPTILTAEFIFVYNQGHIWGIRLVNGKHHKVDSIGGVSPFNIHSLPNIKNIGIILPIQNNRTEFKLQLIKMHNILLTQQCPGQSFSALTRSYTTRMRQTKDNLGDLEIPLGVAIAILETQLKTRRNARGFEPIVALIERYDAFIRQFTRAQYLNLDLIHRYVPGIVEGLMGL
jgi:hypothetical protein